MFGDSLIRELSTKILWVNSSSFMHAFTQIMSMLLSKKCFWRQGCLEFTIHPISQSFYLNYAKNMSEVKSIVRRQLYWYSVEFVAVANN